MTEIRVSGTTHSLALADIEPVKVIPKFGGYTAILEVPDDKTFEEWITRICEVACDLAGDEHQAQAEQLYRDIERMDTAMGKGATAK